MRGECGDADVSIRGRSAESQPAVPREVGETSREGVQGSEWRMRRGKRGSVEFKAQLKYNSCPGFDAGEACVREAYRVIQGMGLEPIQQISNGGLDANWMSDYGFPTGALGSGQHNVHTVNEFLDI